MVILGWVEEWVDFGWVKIGLTHNGLGWVDFKEGAGWDEGLTWVEPIDSHGGDWLGMPCSIRPSTTTMLNLATPSATNEILPLRSSCEIPFLKHCIGVLLDVDAPTSSSNAASSMSLPTRTVGTTVEAGLNLAAGPAQLGATTRWRPSRRGRVPVNPPLHLCNVVLELCVHVPTQCTDLLEPRRRLPCDTAHARVATARATTAETWLRSHLAPTASATMVHCSAMSTAAEASPSP
jgi:hypothetical protein